MKTKIYQIYYQDFQKEQLEPLFISYDNSGKTYPNNFEYAVFFDLFNKINWVETDYLGTVSWKFHQKTGLHCEQVLSHMNENPGADVYFVNPFPELAVYRSIWKHGDEFHKNLSEMTAKLLRAAGIQEDFLYKETPPNLMAFCNYWIGNKVFWEAYIDFLRPLWSYILQNQNELTQIIEKKADPMIGAPYLPFIFERLFSSFLAKESFRVSSVPIDAKTLNSKFFSLPIARRIHRVSKCSRQREVPGLDRAIIVSLLKLMKIRHYYLPQVKKAILAGRKREAG